MTEIPAPCLVCGKPSASHGEHHYRPENPQMGKGMGGTHDHLETVCVCRTHHEMLHDKTLELALYEGVWHYTLPEGTGQRPAVLDEQGEINAWSDEHLAQEWADGDTLGNLGYIKQARAAYVLRKRYGWAEGWYIHAAHLVQDRVGRHVSTGAVYERAQFGLLLEAVPNIDPLELLETFGRKGSASIGKAVARGQDGMEVLEQAQRLVDRMSKTAARQIIDGKTQQKGCDSGPHKCRWCDEEFEHDV